MTNSLQLDIVAQDKYSKVVSDAEKRFEKILGPIGKAHKSFEQFAKATDLEKGMERFDHLGTMIDKVTEKLGGIERPIGMITGVASLAGISALAASWGEMGEKVAIASQGMGMSGEKLQLFLRTAELAGVKGDQAAAGMQALGDTLQDASFGRNPAALNMMTKLHEAYGFSLHRTKDGAVDAADAMDQMAGVMEKIHDPYIQKNIAGIFGISELLPLLREGRNGIAELNQEVIKSGAIMSHEDQNKAKGFVDSVRDLADSLAGVKNAIGSNVSIGTPLVHGFADLIADYHKDIAYAVEGVAAMSLAQSIAWAPKIYAGAKIAWSRLTGAGATAAEAASTTEVAAAATETTAALASVGMAGMAASAGLYGLGAASIGLLARMGVYGVEHWNELNQNTLGLDDSHASWMKRQWHGIANFGYNSGKAFHDAFEEEHPILSGGARSADNLLGLYTGNLPRPVRNHNPWDLRGWNKAGAHDRGGFDIFGSDDEGITAASRQLLTDQREGINTISGIVSKASPASDGNPTTRMIMDVAKDTGFDPYQKLDLSDPATQQKLLPALFRQENGNASFDQAEILRDILTAINRMADNPAKTEVHVPPGAPVPRVTSTSPNAHTLKIGLAMQDGN